ncbi:hypothetical protein E8E13_008122 [Curvularia kusanoi]|uniref:Uncharacterized protein n=1 Tax=Curvularia kusanoi TaxID=90978 RepID=A0A9P4WAD5_CURKU|nr:hypothetical protein E8E13_008122 [Curvularia kusanoi]
MATTEVFIVNDSDSAITLINTSECQRDDKKSAFKGKPSYWRSLPPKAGFRVEPHDTQNVGTIESIYYFDSASWIYFSYAEDTSERKYQVFADLKWKGGVLAQIGPYVSTSTEDNPMPGGSRDECIEYTYRGPKGLPRVYVHIPPQSFWDFLPTDTEKAAAARSSKQVQQITSVLVGTALSTIITTCSLVPPAGLAAITLAGKITIGATAVQGLLGLFTDNDGFDSNARNATMGPMDAYSMNRLALDEFRNDAFRIKLEDMQKHFHRDKDNNDFAHEMVVIAQEVDKKIQRSKDGISIDGSLLESIKMRLSLLDQIVDPDGAFQTDLGPCLNQSLSTSTSIPSKMRMSLGIAGLSMTLNAYTFGCTLRSFLELDTDPHSKSRELAEKAERYTAARAVDYMQTKIEQFANTERVLAYRMSFVKAWGGKSDPGMAFPPAYLQDMAIETCAWAAWDHEEADEWFRDWKWYPHGDYHDAQPVTWSWQCSETVYPLDNTERLKPAKRHDFIWTAYTRKMEELVKAEAAKLWNDPMGTFSDAVIVLKSRKDKPEQPFLPLTVRKALPPHSITITEQSRLRFDGVQYGYSFVNARNGEGPVQWSAEVQPLCVIDNSSVSAGFELQVPQDPDNAKGKAITEQAIAAVKVHKAVSSPQPEPHFATAYRKVYRKMRIASTQTFTEPEALPTLLKTLESDIIVDSWSPDRVIESSVSGQGA